MPEGTILPPKAEATPDPQELESGLAMSAEQKADIMKLNLYRGRAGQPMVSLSGYRPSRFEDYNSVDDYWVQEYLGGLVNGAIHGTASMAQGIGMIRDNLVERFVY